MSLATVCRTDLKVGDIEVGKVNQEDVYYSNLRVKRRIVEGKRREGNQYMSHISKEIVLRLAG